VVTARVARRSAYALGVSCATPMVGAALSVCAVGASAALAEALRRTRPRGIAAREEGNSLRRLGTRRTCSRAPPP